MADEEVRVGEFCRFQDVFMGGIQPAVADIFLDGPGEQMGILQDHAEGPAEVVFFDGLDIQPVVCDLDFPYLI